MPKAKPTVAKTGGRDKKGNEARHAAYIAAMREKSELLKKKNSAIQSARAAAAKAARDASGWTPDDKNYVMKEKSTTDDYFVAPTKKKSRRTRAWKDPTLLRTKSGKASTYRIHKKHESKGQDEDFPEMMHIELTKEEIAEREKLRAEFDKTARAAHERMRKQKLKAAVVDAEKKLKAAKAKRDANPRYQRKMANAHKTVSWAAGQIKTFDTYFKQWYNKIGDGETSPYKIGGAMHSLLEKANGVLSKLDESIEVLGEEITNEDRAFESSSTSIIDAMRGIMEDAQSDLSTLKKGIMADKAEKVAVRRERYHRTHAPDATYSIAGQVGAILDARRERSAKSDE